MKRNNPFSPKRALWKLICLALGVILTGMLAATVGARYLMKQIQYTPAEAGTDVSGPAAALTPVEELKQFADPTDVNWTQLSADLSKKDRKIVNLLLIGQDRRENETASRADSVILCTFNKSSGNLTMTSFLRDLYLPIPGRGSDRLNAAYAYGGAKLLRETLTENFGVRIDGSIEVDFSRFSEVIDVLGGVEIELRQDEAEVINFETGSSLTEGRHLLNGSQTLAYSRIRSLDPNGDFSRTDRQRKVMRAVVDAYRDAGLPVLMKLMKQVIPMLSTDMTEARLLKLALEVFPMLPGLEVSSQSIPSPGNCVDKTINGMAVLVADMDAARKQLQEITTEE